MAQWKYRKPEPSNVRGFCVKCGTNPQKTKSGGKYRALCSLCDKKVHSPNSRRISSNRYSTKVKRPYRKYVKGVCEGCGFIPEHMCQLDVDHIDGNHYNNNEDNLQTLCANCHRLKTHQDRLKALS